MLSGVHDFYRKSNEEGVHETDVSHSSKVPLQKLTVLFGFYIENNNHLTNLQSD